MRGTYCPVGFALRLQSVCRLCISSEFSGNQEEDDSRARRVREVLDAHRRLHGSSEQEGEGVDHEICLTLSSEAHTPVHLHHSQEIIDFWANLGHESDNDGSLGHEDHIPGIVVGSRLKKYFVGARDTGNITDRAGMSYWLGST